MKVHVGALAVSAGVMWGGGILIAGILGLVWPGYAASFLQVAASLYPGYDAGPSPGQVVLGAAYGLADGAVFGVLAGTVYNALAG
jgi:hypothetical protein